MGDERVLRVGPARTPFVVGVDRGREHGEAVD